MEIRGMSSIYLFIFMACETSFNSEEDRRYMYRHRTLKEVSLFGVSVGVRKA